MPVLLYNSDDTEFISADFQESVLTAARSRKLHRHLFILPTARLVRETERYLTSEHYRITKRPIERLPVYTLGEFIREFYGRLEPGRRDITPEIQLVLMELAMKRVELNYYTREGRDPSHGVVERLARVINGVRADGIMPSDFASDIEYARANADDPRFDTVKLQDLYNIYSGYLRLLNVNWIDYAGRMAALNTRLVQDRNATFRGAFPDITSVLVHGFHEFTEPELALLQQLGYVHDLNVWIYFDYAAENGPLYGNFEEAHRRLVVAGYRSKDLDPLATGIREEERRPFRHHMRRNLFRTDDRIGNSSFDDSINVYGFFNREEEAQGIAALVKSLVIDEGYLPERICITTYDLGRYAELFREQLAAHGIPANITAPFALDRNSLTTALLAALAIPANNYDRRDVVRAVTSPYLFFGSQVDAAALTEASARLRIRRGRGAWLRRIRQRIDFLLPRLASVTDEDDRRSIELELETLNRAAQSMNALADTLADFDRRMTPAEFHTAFKRLVAILRTPGNILRLRHDLDARTRTPQDWQRVHDEMERDTRALSTFFRLLEEMTEFFEIEYGPKAKKRSESLRDVSTEDEGADDGRFPLDFYIEQLRMAALRTHYRLREKHDYGVLAAPTPALRGLGFDVVIVCGLVDGEFPSAYIPENFLGRPLPNAQERQLRRERMEFYGAITSSSSRLILTYPRFAGETALVRSSFLDAFLRITTVEEHGRVTELEELRVLRDRSRRLEPLPPHTAFLEGISTYESLAEEAGTSIWSGVEIPRIDQAEGLLANLRHTARVEKERAEAVARQDESIAQEYRGVISKALAPDELEALERRRAMEYSPSQLELYARCPFKYFAQRILSVRAPAGYDVSLTPLERGILVHKVLFQLYSELRAEGELPITEENRPAAIARARELAQEEIAGIVFDHPYWRIDQERLLGSEALQGLLEQWITSDAARMETGNSKLNPEFFEVAFGSGNVSGGTADSELSTRDAMELHELKVRGRVDRVEIYREGDEIYFAVADYKTGVPPSRRDVGEGMSLQLMIYLEVIRHLLAEHYNVPIERVRPVGGLYYRLDSRNVDTKTTALFVPNELKKNILELRASRNDPDTVEELEEIIRDVFLRAAEYVDDMAHGIFHVTTRDVNVVCRNCEHQSVCRVSQVGIPAGN